jgi:hypothetical protein
LERADLENGLGAFQSTYFACHFLVLSWRFLGAFSAHRRPHEIVANVNLTGTRGSGLGLSGQPPQV